MEIKQITTRIVYENRWMRLREDTILRPNGAEGLYSVVEKPTFAVIIPFDGERLTLVEQYRYPVGGRYWEFPQGTMPGLGEEPAQEVATTELAEETGWHAGKLTSLGRLFLAYGLANQAYEVFLAEELVPGDPTQEAEESDMRVGCFTRKEVDEMVANGQIMDSSTVAALYLWDRLKIVATGG